VQIPGESNAALISAQTTSAEASVNIPNDAAGAAEEDKEEQAADARRANDKVIDQRASNLPIPNPDLDDLLELLDQTAT